MYKVRATETTKARIPLTPTTHRQLNKIRPLGMSWDYWLRSLVGLTGEVNNIAGENNEKRDTRKA